MTIMNKAAIGLAIAAAAATSQAATIYSADFSGLGAMESPGSLTTTFSAGGGAATLAFEIAGYASLDAVNCCTDTFHLIVNGTEITSQQLAAELKRSVKGASQAARVLARQELIRLEPEGMRPPSGFERPVPVLNAHQQEAFDAIHSALEKNEFKTFLLEGVTGSGKT